MRKRLLIVLAVATLLLVGIGVLFALDTWNDVERVSIERAPAAAAGPFAQVQTPSPIVPEEEGSTGEDVEVFLLVGSDSREDLPDLEGFGYFEGHRADVVMVLIKTTTGTGVLSLPRDLWVESACGGDNRIGSLLEGCRLMNGPTLLTVSVEDLIDHTVDHFAMVDLAGFQEAVDAVGGYEICVDRPVRDTRSLLDLPAGCTQADGDQTLAWLRSRHTQELTKSGWRAMAGVNDLTRNDRQRQFLIDMLGHLADFRSPQDLAAAAQAIAPFVTVDDELGIFDAVDIAWTMRSFGEGAVTELSIPVLDHVTDAGASVLVASTPPDEVVSDFLAQEATRAMQVGSSG